MFPCPFILCFCGLNYVEITDINFDNVDKVYTYLSPDIEYCRGHHLPSSSVMYTGDCNWSTTSTATRVIP